MKNLFRSNDSGGEPEDFVLFRPEENTDNAETEYTEYNKEEYNDAAADGTEAVSGRDTANDSDTANEAENESEELSVTRKINTDEVTAALVEQSAYEEKSGFGKTLYDFINKHKVASICAGAAAVVLIVASLSYGMIISANPLRGYEQTAVERGSVTRTMEVEGTLSTDSRYEITSLVAGKIIESDFEVGDEVSKNDVLYQLDDTEAKLAVERAKNELDKASDTTLNSSNTTVRITATETGVISNLNIATGSSVTAGGQIGTIKKADGTVVPLMSYVSGTVTVVSVRSGQNVSTGQLVASVRLAGSTNEKSTAYDKKSSEIDLQTAQKQLQDYTIKSPVSGIVTEKNNRVGDNVGITNSDKPMMVVLDTSKLTFTFSVDEYRVREIKKGQAATVSVDSIPDTAFSGEVTAVSAEGKRNEEGKTMFDVMVSIYEPGDLKAGMNVKAKVILDSVTNALYVSEKALMESDGQNALVFVKVNADDNAGGDDTSAGESLENELAYPWIKVPKGCELIRVKYGISDGNNVHILSGLRIADIVVYDPEKTEELVVSTADSKDDKGQKSDNLFDDEADKDDSDEDTEKQLQSEIDRILQGTDNL